jgi:hypothetical protein
VAIAYVNAGAATSGATNPDTDIDVGIPAALVSGNLLIGAVHTTASTGAHGWPAGWTKVEQRNDGVGGSTSWAYKVSNGADTAPNVTVSSSYVEGQIFQFSGGVTDGSNRTSNNGATGTHSVSALTSTADNAWVIYLDVGSPAGTALTTPSGFTSDYGAANARRWEVGHKAIATAPTSSGAISTSGPATSWTMFFFEVVPPLDYSHAADIGLKVDASSDYEFWPYEHDADIALKVDASSDLIVSENVYAADIALTVTAGGTDTYEFHTPLNYQHDMDVTLGVSVDAVVDGPELMQAELKVSFDAAVEFTTGVGGSQTIGRMPLIESTGEGIVEYVGTGAGTLPKLVSAGLGHSALNAVSLSSLTASGTSINGVNCVGAGAMPQLTSAGTARVDGTAAGDLSLGSLTASGYAYVAIIGAGAGTLPKLTSAGEGQVGIGVTSTSISLGSLSTAGSSWSEITATASGTLPRIISSGAAVVGDSANRKWVVMNVGNGAVSEYEDWTFDSIVTFNGDTLLLGAAGIAVVGGTADDTAQIEAYITTGKVDHGSESSKRPTDAYVGLKTPGSMELTVTGKYKGLEQSYTYTVPYGEDEEEAQKVDLGRGFESRYLQYKLANRDGSDFTIDALTVLAQVTGRRG